MNDSIVRCVGCDQPVPALIYFRLGMPACEVCARNWETLSRAIAAANEERKAA